MFLHDLKQLWTLLSDTAGNEDDLVDHVQGRIQKRGGGGGLLNNIRGGCGGVSLPLS